MRGSSASRRARAERAGGQPAEPRVVGWVDAEHVAREGRTGQPLGHDGAVAGERREHVLGQVRVVQGLARRGVPDDEEGAMAVGQGHVVHGPRLAHPVEELERVVAVVVAPAVEGRLACAGHVGSRKPEQTRSIRPTRPSRREHTTDWVSTRALPSGSKVSL